MRWGVAWKVGGRGEEGRAQRSKSNELLSDG